MMQSSPYLPIRSLRVFTACLLSLLMFAAPMAPLAASVNRTNAARLEKKTAAKSAKSTQKQTTAGEALERSLFVNPFAPPPVVGPIIGATMSDSFVDTTPVSGRADPGSIVTYNAVISNTGSGAGTGVNFMDTVDPNTTLINASIKFSPIAINDAYNGTQNTTLNVSAPGVLTNDTGQPAPTATAIAAGATTQGGTVTLNANGSFSYDPPNAGFTGTDTFTYTITNGQAPPSPADAQATVTITVGTPNTAPVANDDTASATEAGGAANGTAGTNPTGNLITGVGAGSVTDTDAEDASSALIAVQVHTGPEGGSTGTGTIGNPLAGSFGSLTLNSNGSYTYTVDNNNATVQALRTSGQSLNDIFNYTIQDTGGLQDTATFTITIAGANDNPVAVADTPTAVEAGGTANGTAGTDPSGNVLTNDTDVDSVANGETKTVQGVAVGNQAGPLSTNVGVGLSGAGAANYGTLTIMADGSFTYVVNQTNATIEALGVGQTQTDTFSYTMKDAANVTSTTTVTVTIQGADDNPVAVNDAATVNEDAAATAVTVLTNDTDVDAGPKNIASLTQPANGTVVGTGPAGAFTGLTYQPNANYCNNPPGSTLDTFTYTLNGGSTATVSMTVTCINDAPTFTKGPDQNISEDAGGQTVVGWATGIGPGGGADEAGQTLTFVITNNTNSALFSAGPSVAANGTLTYTTAANAFGTATITLKITDNGPTGGSNVNESATQSFIINVGAVNDAPVVDLNGGAGGIDVAAAFTEDSGGVTLAPAATVSDVDDTNLESATITLTNRPDGAAESLSVDTTGTTIVAAAYVSGTGVLALSGTDTVAHYQQVIRTAKYNNTSQNPNTTSRSITFTVNDGDVDSAVATATVTVTAVNDAPVVDLNGTGTGGINTTATFTEDGGAIVMAGATDVTDVDNNNLVSATITLTNRPDGALESLSVDTTGTLITADAYVPGTGVLFLHGTDTLANYQQVLRTAKYNNTDQDPDTTARIVNFKGNDGAVDSTVATATITVIAVNDAPVLAAIEGGNLTYTENDPATSVTSTMTLTDVDSANMIGATVQITGNYQSGQDVLSFVNTPNITGSYNSGNGTMTLSGTDTKANYQAALRAVKYNNTSDDPNTTTRTVTFQVNDGGAVNNLSNTQTRNITVVAVNDPPTAFGFASLPAQAGIPITYPAGKLGGSDLEAGTTITIDTVPINVTNGTVVINANGSFTFTPLPGTAGGSNNASFQYRVSDNGNPGPGVNGNYVTVSFNPAGPAIFFTKSVAVAPGNCTLGAECTIATAVTNIGALTNANIFIEDANTQSPGNITLTSGSSIIGQGVTGASFDSFFGIGAPAQGTLAARPSINQARPTINGAATITAHNSSQMRGFNYTPSGNGLVAASRTGLVVSDMNITSTSNTAGQFAVNFTSSSGTFTFGDVVVSGANIGSGVNFGTTTSASTVTFNNITTAAGKAFQASSTGSTNFTFNDVTSTTGRAVDLNTGTGTFTFHKIVANGADNGVIVAGITGGFTVNGDSTTAGTGGTIQNTTNSGMKFTSSNNITLKNMNLTNDAQTQVVTGPSSTCGGDLAAGNNLSCIAGLFLQTTTTVVLNNLSISGSKQQGINGNATNGLTITNSNISGNGDEGFENGILLQNASGTIGITGSTVNNNRARQVHIGNLSGTMTLNANTSNLGRTAVPANGDAQQGVLLQLMGTSNSTINATTLTINNSVFNNPTAVYTNAFQINADNGSPTVNGSITSSSFNTYAAAVFVNAGGTANVTFDTMNNATMLNTNLQAINYTILGGGAAITAKITGTISGNTINGCLPVGSNCHGIDLNMGTDQNGELHLLISGNNVQQTGGGVTMLADGAAAPGTTKAHLKIVSNSFTNPGGGALAIRAGIELQAALSSPGGPNISVCTNIGGAGAQNTITGNWGHGSSDSGIFLRQRFSAANSWVLPGYGGANNDSTAVQTYLNGRNTISGATFSSTASTTTGAYANGSCTTPLLIGSGGVEAASLPWSLASASRYDLPLGIHTSTLSGSDTTAPIRNVTNSLTQNQLDSITVAAIERWSNTGLTPQQLDILRGIHFDVTDLGAEYLGESEGSHVQIDRNAGGKGWFTGVDAASDSLFSRVVSSTRRYTDPLSAPAGHLDLLTAIEHELGHKLGLDDSYSSKDRDNLMYGYLTVGERRLPASGQALNSQAGNARSGRQGTQHLKLRASAAAVTRRTANAARRSDNPNTPLAGGTVNVSIGTLPAGKSVAITFQAQLNVSMPLGTNTVSTQGTVSGGNFSSVLTDDQPGTAAPNEPTVTPVDSPTAAGSNVSGTILDSNGNPVEGAAIRMSGAQNRLTVTDSNGFYHFEDVDTNGFYTVVPTRPNFTFNPSQRSFSQLGNHTDAVFTATAGSSGFVNPLDETVYFVRQQYVDFLGREPDESGLGFWVNNIEGCGADANCRAGKRIDTSAAFFLSIEFQQTGYLVYKTYQAAFGDLAGAPVPIKLGEFKPDTAAISKDVVVNATGWQAQLDANTVTYMSDFVQRARFTSAYPVSMTPQAFVDKLFATANVTPTDGDRTAAVNEFAGAGTTADVAARGRALRRVAENSLLSRQEFNQAFVLMQYFGYLRRDPNSGQDTDFSGYNFWLSKLNTFNGNFSDAEMVKSFLVSGEYRGRFPR